MGAAIAATDDAGGQTRDRATVATVKRIVGLDLARSLAIFGMVFVNYKNAMKAFEGAPDWLIFLLTRFEGRASVTFVTLAGMGIILLSQRARESGDPDEMGAARNRVLRRSLFILVLGILNFQVWPGDILHFYGFYLGAGAFLLYTRPRKLWIYVLAAFVIAFVLRACFDRSVGYDSDGTWYFGYLTPVGFVRNTFFNGVHPFFPWVCYALIGMWFAQLPYKDPAKRKRLLLVTLPLAIGLELILHLISVYTQVHPHDFDEKTVLLHFSTLPVSMGARIATAMSVILISLMIAERWRESRIVNALATTGRMALTHYLAHTILLLGPMFVLGYLENTHTRMFSVWMSLGFFSCAVTFSVLWSKRYKQGPLEYVMRRIAD